MSTGPDHQPPEPAFPAGPAWWQAPVGRHRISPPRLGPVLAALVVLVAVVALGGAVAGSQLNADERFREFVNTAAMDERVSARTFDLTVLAVRTAATVNPAPGEGHETGGVWVLVRIRVMAREEPLSVRYAAVRGPTGRTWLATGRFDQPLIDGAYRLEPGIPVEGEIAFEVPRDVATDLTVRVAEPSIDLRMKTVAEVRLPVDEQMVADGLADPETAVVAQPEIVIADPQILVGAGEAGR